MGDPIIVKTDVLSKTPLIGILCWEEGCSPRGLAQLEKLPGNSTNPKTFDFPVKYCRIKGANIHTILENPCQHVLQSMIGEARKMEAQGVCAITTSCGFNAIFQRELADSVSVPVFTSSLMQIPLVQNMLGKQQQVGVITAKKNSAYRKTPETCWRKKRHFNSYRRSGNLRRVEQDIFFAQ